MLVEETRDWLSMSGSTDYFTRTEGQRCFPN